MQQKPGTYTFLLTHSNRSKIYIRRVEVSKRLINSSVSALLAITIGATSFAAVQNASIAGSIIAANKTVVQQPAEKLVAQTVSLTAPEEVKSPDYERPEVLQSDIAATANLGGPEDFSFRLTNLDTEGENQIEDQIRLIERTSNPENLPTMWAKAGKINNEFSFRRNPFGGRSYEFHTGLDIDGEKGDIVLASGNGIVKKAGWTGGYGNLLEIDHGNGLTTRYGHLSRIDVNVGDAVNRGQEVALVGSTGRSTGPHLHFEVRIGEKSVNPRRFLPREAEELKGMSKK